MNRYRLFNLILLAFVATLFAAAWQTPTTAYATVELEYFEATFVDGEIELVWETASEIGIDFFYLERATTLEALQDGEHLGPGADPHAIAPCLAGTDTPYLFIPTYGGSGGAYAYYDCSADLVNGQTYHYVLVDRDSFLDEYVPLEWDCATAGISFACVPGLSPPSWAVRPTTPAR